MKLKIDGNGHLWKECAGIMKRMECKNCVDKIQYHYCLDHNDRSTNKIAGLINSFRPCGDWCPLFDVDKPKYGQGILSLCKKEYHFKVEEFTDERVKQGKDES